MDDQNRICNIMNPKFETICARIRQHQQKQNKIENSQLENHISRDAESPSASTASFNQSPLLSSISGHSSRAGSPPSTPDPATNLSLSSGIGSSFDNTGASFTDSVKYSSKTELKFSIEAILRSDFASNNVGFFKIIYIRKRNYLKLEFNLNFFISIFCVFYRFFLFF